eukprot:m.6805 g.6805  ORF g.6805 m.6805 type:complete len:67 (-) comp8604_c0_seq1:45-245(-)
MLVFTTNAAGTLAEAMAEQAVADGGLTTIERLKAASLAATGVTEEQFINVRGSVVKGSHGERLEDV